MANDDPTQDLPDEQFSTKPTIETVLQRINELGNRLSAEIQTLRLDMEKGFRNLERRLDVVSADINQLRADFQYLDDRLMRLEKEKA